MRCRRQSPSLFTNIWHQICQICVQKFFKILSQHSAMPNQHSVTTINLSVTDRNRTQQTAIFIELCEEQKAEAMVSFHISLNQNSQWSAQILTKHSLNIGAHFQDTSNEKVKRKISCLNLLLTDCSLPHNETKSKLFKTKTSNRLPTVPMRNKIASPNVRQSIRIRLNKFVWKLAAINLICKLQCVYQ